MATQTAVPLHTLRVDQVGSLLRPTWLKEIYARHGQGQVSDDELRQAQDRAIRSVVARQEALGLPVITDGEFRRLNFQDSFTSSVTGWALEHATAQTYERRVAGAKPFQRWKMGGFTEEGKPIGIRRPAHERIRLAHNEPLQEYLFSRTVARRPVKVTLIDTDRIAERFDYANSRSVYPDVEQFISDVVSIQHRMVSELAEAGCRYVQIDGPSYTAYVDTPSLAEMRARGADPVASMERSIRAAQRRHRRFPRRHLRPPHLPEQSAQHVASRGGLRRHRRMAIQRSRPPGLAPGVRQPFEPLRLVPKGKVVMLGLVSTKVPQLETADELKRRIEAASRYLPLEQLALSPQCGFAATIVGNVLSEEDQWRKLELIQKVAAEVWG